MSTRTSRGRISNIRPLTMLPSLKSRRDFAISSCISVIAFTHTNHGYLRFHLIPGSQQNGCLHDIRGKPNLARKRLSARAESRLAPVADKSLRIFIQNEKATGVRPPSVIVLVLDL